MDEEKTKKKNRKSPEHRKKRRKRLIVGSFGLTSILLFLFTIFILMYGNVLLKNFIIKTVDYRSNGMYRVELEEIKVNFLKLGFEVNNFHLIPDQAIYRNRKSRGEVKTGLYDIRVPHFEVSGLRLLTAFYENSFIIQTMHIDKPDLRLLDVPIFRNSIDYDEGYDDIRPIIVDLVEYFLVRDLIINEGVFDIFLEKEGEVENFTASRISLRLKDFQIDKKNPEGQEKFLYSDGAELVFKDYKLVLNDGIHIIDANEIGLNTIDSVVYARGFSMNPSQISKADLRAIKKSYFSIFFPEILLNGADIIKAYEQDTFNIKKLLVLRPKINYFNQTPLSERVKSTKTLKNQVDIFPLFKGYLNEVNIAEFKLDKGNFRYGEPLEKVPENIKISGIDVLLEDFKVDSIAYADIERIMYSKNIELDFSSFEMSLRDSVHILEAKSLFISSKEQVLRAKDLQIHPLKNFNRSIKKDQLNILLPNIEINGIDFFRMYIKGELIANEFLVSDPIVNIDIKKQAKTKTQREDKSASDIYNLFSRYLNSSKINRISINNGSIDFDQNIEGKNEEIIADNISLTLYNFFLDSTGFVKENKFLFSENIDFELKDYDFLLPNEINEIKVGLFQFSSKKREMNLIDISMKALRKDTIRKRLYRQNKSGYLEFDIPSIKLKNADIIRALNDRHIAVENIFIEKPHLHAYKFDEMVQDTSLPPSMDIIKEEIQNILPLINVENIYVNDGEIYNYKIFGDSSGLNYSNKFYMEMGSLSLMPDSLTSTDNHLFFSKKIKLVLENQVLDLNDGLHQIISDSMIFTFPERQLKIIEFYLKPIELNGQSHNEALGIDITSPVAIFDGVRLNKLYNEQVLNVKSGYFDTIQIALYQRITDKNVDTTLIQDFNMPRILKKLNLSSLKIDHGSIKYLNTQSKIIAEADFEGEIIKSELSNNTTGRNAEKLPFEDFKFLLPHLTFNAYKLDHKFAIDSIEFDLGNNEISTKSIAIIVDSSQIDSIHLSKSAYSISKLDSVNIKGIDFHNFYVDRKANLESISLWNPKIELHHYPDSGSKQSLKKFDLYPELSEFINELNIGEILINNGDVKRFNHQLDSNQLRASLDKIFIDLIDFRIDSLSKNRDRFLFSDNVHFRLKDYLKILPGEMNKVVFDEIGFSTGESKIYAKGTHLEPMFDDYNYSRILGYQSDRVEAHFNKIELNGVDLENLYTNNELRAAELFIDSFYIDDFRDKRVEFDEDFRPAMIHEFIRNIPIPFSIDSLNVSRGNAKYREFALDGEEEGEIFFNDIFSKIYFVSNDSSYYSYNPSTYMFALGKLANQGDIFMSGNFNLLDTNNTFNIRGSLGLMDMTAVNPMTENVAFVSVKSGVSRSLNFDFKADEDYAQGDLNFRYSKFKIFVINKKTGEPEGLEEGIVSWFANTFLINTKNPHLGFFKEGKIYFRRDKSKSIVNYVWKSIYSGIKTSIGAQTQKKLHKIAEKEEKALKKK